MGIVYIENRTYARYESRYNPRDLKDLKGMKFTPQILQPNKSLVPEASFVLANTFNLLMLIHIALADDGKYYFGFSIHIDESGSSCHPAPGLNISKGNETLFGCVSDAIQYCSKFSVYLNTRPDSRITKYCDLALKELNRMRLYQMSIFDFI